MMNFIQVFIGRFLRTPKVWEPDWAAMEKADRERAAVAMAYASSGGDLAEKAAADLDDICRFELTEKGEAALAKPKRKSSAKKTAAKKAPAKRKTTRKATAKKKA